MIIWTIIIHLLTVILSLLAGLITFLMRLIVWGKDKSHSLSSLLTQSHIHSFLILGILRRIPELPLNSDQELKKKKTILESRIWKLKIINKNQKKFLKPPNESLSFGHWLVFYFYLLNHTLFEICKYKFSSKISKINLRGWFIWELWLLRLLRHQQ